MSRHEGVSCDACMKANFRGRRYKCLTCYDYDLCSTCYENSAVTNQHSSEHPMQCILTRHEFDIFHGGEALFANQPQSLTCPFCGKMGHTEATLKEHVAANHPDTSSYEVVCPICASVFGGDPNHITDDFAGHLAIDHQFGAPRDLDVAENGTRHNVRRISQQTRGFGRGVTRQNMRFGVSRDSLGLRYPNSVISSSVSSSIFSSHRDSMDPIAELLSQLSGVRRPTGADLSPSIHYDQATLRQHIRRGAPARVHGATGQNVASGTANTTSSSGVTNSAMKIQSGASSNLSHSSTTQNSQSSTNQSNKNSDQQSQFLLTRLGDLEKEHENKDSALVKERSEFVQELLLSTLSSVSSEENSIAQLPALQGPTMPVTAEASTQTVSANTSLPSVVSPNPTFCKQPAKQPTTKSSKYSYLSTSSGQQPLRGLSGMNAPTGNGRSPTDVSSNINKKKSNRGGGATQPPH